MDVNTIKERFKKINIGCGYNKLDEYLNVDVDKDCHPDIVLADNDLSFLPKGHFSEVLAWDVLEHIPHQYTMPALLDWAALLEKDGRLRMQTSYVFGVIDRMRHTPSFETEFNWMKCLFGNQAHPGDFHHNGFTETTLTVYLKAAGFHVDAFEIRDQWLISCDAIKRTDWQAAVDLNTDEEQFVRDAYTAILGREAEEHALLHYQGKLANLSSKMTLIRSLTASPENLYNIGFSLN